MTRSIPIALALLTSVCAFSVSAQTTPATAPAAGAAVAPPAPETSVPRDGANNATHLDARPDGAATAPAGMSASTPKPDHADDQAQTTSSKHARSTKRRAEDRPSNTTH